MVGTFGPLDILVNNAGIQHRQPLLDLSEEDWRRVVDVNLTSAFLVAREAARLMIAAGTDILTISRRLGHRKASVTLDTYGHLVKGKDAEAARAIEGLLK